MTLTLERIPIERADWERMDSFHDRVVFQTREWIEFVARTQHAEPMIAEVRDRGACVGYLTGLIVKRFGVRILGSPFPGWTTGSLGFNLEPGVSRRAALEALPAFAFKQLRCPHVELKDPGLGEDEIAGLGWDASPFFTYVLDLSRDEEEIFAGMSSACRRAIRKGEKNGVTVEEADDEEFALDYHAQLVDVFEKQDLKPTYPAERVVELVRQVHPTGRLLLLRARSAEGESIATGIFPAMNGVAYFWGGASWRSHQGLRPNEALMWHAIRHWKAHGVTTLDMGGGGEYKLRYGPDPAGLTVPHIRRSRLPGLMRLRDAAGYLRTRRLG